MTTVLKQYFLLQIILIGVIPIITNAQTNEPSAPFPSDYYNLSTDTTRMRFLMNTINDSLNSGQLNLVYDMAREGLVLAEKNNVDTMKGIFYFDVAKAFSYQFGKPDSAIFYYKKVLPYFPDKLNFYNLVSMREIMERFVQAAKKDSVFAYLDSLHERIDTMDLTNPRRYGISSAMAGVYQYYGMFRTAITIYENSIEGLRKAGHPRDIGLPMANLAELYDESEDDINAVRYAREALGHLSGNNMPFMGTAANLATYYTNLNRIDSALYFNKLSDSVAHLTHNVVQEHVRDQFNYVDILCSEKKYNEAKKALVLVKPWLDKSVDQPSIVRYLLSFASIDTGLNQWGPAADTLLHAFSVAKESGQEIYIVLALQELAVVNAKLKNFREAYRYQQEYMEHKDSLTSDETKSRLADFEAMNKTRQKEQHIALLQKDNDIKNLQLKNSRQRNVLYLGGFIFLLAATGIAFYQRNRRLKIQGQKIKAELQMQLLRSQMNPHFIFNSLNGIENFILKNDKRQASEYLNKFARLIRIILSNSRKEGVAFTDDMETIQLYIDLELLRFNNKFCYIKDIDPALLEADYRVPPLLIQPFVENAIVHGFAYSGKRELQLLITSKLEDDYIIYKIEDNGVGRAEAAVYKARNKSKHVSLGLQITNERINIFNEQHHAQNMLKIEDLYDVKGQPSGTSITIKVKTI
ncbi:MAG: tetratricopeptide repeat-containing sensor histidine kinase [Ginsengibacter sp.]